MKIIFLIIGLLMSGCQLSFATQCVIPTIYATNGQVTSVNLNGNFSACQGTVNGNLDNTNANTAAGYRFYQTVSALPSAGNQGATYFLTSDNSLNLDNGSSFNKLISPSGSAAQGEVLFYGASGLTYTGVGTSGQPLISQGAGANATFGNISAAGSVSGAALTSLSSTQVGAGLFPTANIGGLFGPRVTKTPGTIYQSLTDSILFVYANCTINQGIVGYSDVSATPSTIVGQSTSYTTTGVSFSFPVIKNQYYQVTTNCGTTNEYFVSIGS